MMASSGTVGKILVGFAAALFLFILLQVYAAGNIPSLNESYDTSWAINAGYRYGF
jgi:hypothetical protein